MGKKAEASLFERFVIMLMGLGVLLVGAYPLTRQHGGLFKYLKTKGIDVGGIESYLDSASRRARLKYKEIKDDSVKLESKKVERNPIKKEEKSIDSMSGDDREDLNKLLDKVVD